MLKIGLDVAISGTSNLTNVGVWDHFFDAAKGLLVNFFVPNIDALLA